MGTAHPPRYLVFNYVHLLVSIGVTDLQLESSNLIDRIKSTALVTVNRFFGKNTLRRRRWIRYSLTISGGVVLAYGVGAYAILPAIWRHYEHNPKLANSPKVTHTGEGIPGDPVNIGLVGTRPEVVNNTPIEAPNPPAIQAKHRIWEWLRGILY